MKTQSVFLVFLASWWFNRKPIKISERYIPLQADPVLPPLPNLLVAIVEATDIEGELVAVAREEPVEDQGPLVFGLQMGHAWAK